MKHSVPHNLGQERARKVADQALTAYSKKFANYNPTVKWTDANRAELSFSVKGMSVSGTVEVLERSIDLDIEVPFLLRPFKSQALGVIDSEINEWLKKAQAEG